MPSFDPILILIALALVIAGYGLGRWRERRNNPLWLEGRLLDEQKRLAQRIAALKVGETAEEVAEKARQQRVREDILRLDQVNQTP